jgi:hypothetical protein
MQEVLFIRSCRQQKVRRGEKASEEAKSQLPGEV